MRRGRGNLWTQRMLGNFSWKSSFLGRKLWNIGIFWPGVEGGDRESEDYEDNMNIHKEMYTYVQEYTDTNTLSGRQVDTQTDTRIETYVTDHYSLQLVPGLLTVTVGQQMCLSTRHSDLA